MSFTVKDMTGSKAIQRKERKVYLELQQYHRQTKQESIYINLRQNSYSSKKWRHTQNVLLHSGCKMALVQFLFRTGLRVNYGPSLHSERPMPIIGRA